MQTIKLEGKSAGKKGNVLGAEEGTPDQAATAASLAHTLQAASRISGQTWAASQQAVTGPPRASTFFATLGRLD